MKRLNTCLLLTVAAAGLGLTPSESKASRWSDVDALRLRLERNGVRVTQGDCKRGLQGAYDSRRNYLIVCRAHRTPGQVWNTLAHEAAHRMQDCAGGLISRPEHVQAMVNTLSRYSPQDIASLRAYPRSQHRIEIEARYTAKLPPQQVMQLFDRYCSGPQRQGFTIAGYSKKVHGEGGVAMSSNDQTKPDFSLEPIKTWLSSLLTSFTTVFA
ncbi:hypothetical protein [Synechococcus sp. CC9616]|uniref:hypothetical protein n=1 Tax=Synechococcus sp. CC9616 TaxID=110663 RepID=UPI0018DDF87C|nr:hypothetical protein [Synechococcus sp. CC9616]